MKAQPNRKKEPQARNRKASFEVAVEETFEAGIVLTGDEIKSIRADRLQLTGAYVRLLGGEPALIGLHLSLAKDPERTRKLLLHMAEIERLKGLLQAKGKTAIPLSLYLKKGWAKVQIGVGSGKRSYDKREAIKRRDLEREQQGQLKRSRKA